VTDRVRRKTHKRVVYCTGCDRFHWLEHIHCACEAGTAPVCKTTESCSECRVDRLHPVFAEILSAMNGG
jgi:hypothetical protein